MSTEIEKQTVKDYEGASTAALLSGITALCIALFHLITIQLYVLAAMMFIISYIIHFRNKEYQKHVKTQTINLKLKDSQKWGDV